MSKGQLLLSGSMERRETQPRSGGIAIVRNTYYMDKKVKEQFARWGRKGGLANKKKGKAYFSEIGKRGAASRWSNKLEIK